MTIDDTTLLRSGRCLGETAHEANAASPAHTTATRKSWKCDVSCGPKTSQDGTICTHPRPPSLAALPSCHSASCQRCGENSAVLHCVYYRRPPSRPCSLAKLPLSCTLFTTNHHLVEIVEITPSDVEVRRAALIKKKSDENHECKCLLI